MRQLFSPRKPRPLNQLNRRWQRTWSTGNQFNGCTNDRRDKLSKKWRRTTSKRRLRNTFLQKPQVAKFDNLTERRPCYYWCCGLQARTNFVKRANSRKRRRRRRWKRSSKPPTSSGLPATAEAAEIWVKLQQRKKVLVPSKSAFTDDDVDVDDAAHFSCQNFEMLALDFFDAKFN